MEFALARLRGFGNENAPVATLGAAGYLCCLVLYVLGNTHPLVRVTLHMPLIFMNYVFFQLLLTAGEQLYCNSH